MTNLFGSICLAGMAFASLGLANSEGAPVGYTGAPGDNGTCAACHGGAGGAGRIFVTFPGGSTYNPGQVYRVRVTLEDPTARRWGYSASVKKEASAEPAGSIAIPAVTPVVSQLIGPGSNRYLTHSPGGTFRAQTSEAAWEFDWTAPAAGTGTVRFYVAGNAANNDTTDQGDRIYSSNLSIAEASGQPPAITAGNAIMPQFVFGGGWTAWLYFTNRSSSQVSFPVRFYNDSAAEMPFGGTATRQIIIPPNGTALIQAQNTGSLSQGWATWDTPAGVTGYGVLRQASVQPAPDQEAVVPFANTTSTTASLTYDDSNLVTAVALWYNGSGSSVVTVTARDEQGSVVGTTNITMQPGTKQAFALRDKVEAVNGKRGVVEFSTPTGNIAVLGLRFTNSAFTSIPANQ